MIQDYRPICLNCDTKINNEKIVYQKSHWIPHEEEWEGIPRAMKEVFTDGGVFCSDNCVMEYLWQKYDIDRDKKIDKRPKGKTPLSSDNYKPNEEANMI